MRTLLVAGFTSPIVEALIDLLTPSDWRLLGLYLSRTARAEALAVRARERGIATEIRRCDLKDAEQSGRLAEDLPSAPAPVDLLYAVGAPIRLQALARSRPEDFRTQLDTQLFGALHLVRFLAPWWRRERASAVFVLSSVTLGDRSSGLGPYVAAKYALLGLARTLADEHAAHGLSVAAVSPAAFDSALWEQVPEPARPSSNNATRPAAVDPARIAATVLDLLGPARLGAGNNSFLNVPVGYSVAGVEGTP